MTRALASLSLLASLAACGEEPAVEQQRQAVLAGAVDTQAAVGIVVHGTPTQLCSGTLIAPRLVLTAAHCTTGTIYFIVGADTAVDPVSGTPQGKIFEVDQFQVPKSYTGAAAQSDIALLHLSAEVPAAIATPVAIDATPVSVGDSVKVVGFGVSVEGNKNTAGTRRSRTSAVSKVNVTTFSLPPQAGSCHGDSGGPVLKGGQVVGVQAGVDGSCANGSRHMRVDVYHGWLVGATAALEGTSEAPAAAPAEEPTTRGYGERCELSADCASQICITVSGGWFSSSYSACTQACDPDANDCPGGDRCDAKARVCVPPRDGDRSSSTGKGDELRVEVMPDGAFTGGCSVSGAGATDLAWMLLPLLALLRRRPR